MSVRPPGGPLTDDDVRTLATLLARFASHDLDQFEHWRVETPYGDVYVSVQRERPVSSPEEVFVTVWPLPQRLREH